ncbi:SDR family oxidoreductase [Niabella pedocola]|uniref:SDR family oxidoreductase n=1 Tax=Niabella pedocola TaxID=1752077 RepID=A0ABS8PK69_9BACT|nr:SDR family oxidoreductase [Niabella pedocola]MCD2421270.1 SDR family oxidoreductase [Niabella pedocola]
MEFNHKTAIVTGAGQGIGFELCHRLVAAGAAVVLNDVDAALGQKAAAVLHAQYPGRVYAVAGDCSNPAVIRQLVTAAVEQYGHLDIVIANAGITLFGDFLDYSQEAFYQVLQVNLGGSFFLAQAAAHKMKEQGTGGSILFMSSVTGHLAHKGLVAYGMTKAALEMLARNLVIELSPYGINSNSIAPGATLTERTLADADYASKWEKITPGGRAATVADIAEAALFLVHEKARHINGQNIVIDGGWSCVGVQPD